MENMTQESRPAQGSFAALHRGPEPLLLGNAWDPMSARLLQESGFKAIGTSSAAIARSAGFEDGENLPFADMVRACSAIARSITIPLSIDMEAGYSRTGAGVCENVQKMLDIGAVGINLEDSRLDGERKLIPAEEFSTLLATIKNFLLRSGSGLFVNARCDAYLLKHPDQRREALHRTVLYRDAGADGIFLPRITGSDEIAEAASTARIPLNVLVGPGLPGMAELARLGVRRISMGSAFHGRLFQIAGEIAARVVSTQSFAELV